MRTTKGIPGRLGLWSVALGALLLFSAASANAETGTCTDESNCTIGSDRPASLVIFPKIEVDLSRGLDTIVQLANAGERRTINVVCDWVNANGECSNNGDICRQNSDCPQPGGQCLPRWTKRDFLLTLTKRQPISFRASEGLPFLPCDEDNPDRNNCIQDDQGNAIFNTGNIPDVGEDPFIGELKCWQVNENEEPVDFNELKGEATIISAGSTTVDASKYNAIGIQALPGRVDTNQVLCLGGGNPDDCPNGAEYVGCPQTLILDHFFEGAEVDAGRPPLLSSDVTSRLTVVPCSEDFLNDPNVNLLNRITVQYLIFNEFEQRFSTSYRVSCFDDRRLADVDTRVGNTADDAVSIFSVSVQGTISGQTRLRSVATPDEARGILAVLEESHECSTGPDGLCRAAKNVHYQGSRTQGDIIRY